MKQDSSPVLREQEKKQQEDGEDVQEFIFSFKISIEKPKQIAS